MDITIKINMDNAAFGDNGLEKAHEAAHIISELAHDLHGADFDSDYDRELTLRDYNGNTVGKMKVTGR